MIRRLRTYFWVALVFWLAVATYGLILRWHLAWPLPIRFTYWLHAHSHAAFLGWLHAGFMLFLAYVLIPERFGSRGFRRLFVFLQLMVAGLMISFPIQGYKAFSIAFLSLFLSGTYFWAYWYLKTSESKRRAYPMTYALGRTGIVFMLISSVSPWMLGPVMVMLGKQSIWYNLDIYFYLHFQYNGWFFLALLALSAYLLEQKGIRFPAGKIRQINRLLFWGVLLGYLTNTLWTEPPLWVNLTAMLSVFFEAAALWMLYRLWLPHRKILMPDAVSAELIRILVVGLVLKVTFQFTASCPYFARLAYTDRDLVIGYLHWVFLGIFSVFLLYWMHRTGIFRLRRKAFRTFFAGFLWMDLLIFVRGTLTWWHWTVPQAFAAWIFWATLLMYAGILWIAYDASKEILRTGFRDR